VERVPRFINSCIQRHLVLKRTPAACDVTDRYSFLPSSLHTRK